MANSVSDPDPRYHAWLLRIWQSDGACWQASLQDSGTGTRLGFANLEALFAFLVDEMETNRGKDDHEQTQR